MYSDQVNPLPGIPSTGAIVLAQMALITRRTKAQIKAARAGVTTGPQADVTDRPAPSVAAPASPPDDPLDPPEGFVRRDEAKAPQTLKMPLSEDGSINLEGLRPETVARLKAAIASTEGLRPEPPPVPLDLCTPAMASHLYALLGGLEVQLAIRVWRIPQADAERIFTYSPQDLAVLGPPTAKVINKYSPAIIGRYQEELELVLALLAVHQNKIIALRQLSAPKALGPATAAQPEPQKSNGGAAADVLKQQPH